MGGAEVARPFVEAAKAEHPSLIDESHQMDALFGVVNIPMVTWIDEAGMIVRPPERGSPAPAETDDELATRILGIMHGSAPDPERYANRIRDWVHNGADSRYALTPDEVVARSRPRPIEVSQAAAHFEIAQHLWRTEGLGDAAIGHFNAAHTLQPDNITYKRQAYSALGVEKMGGDERGRFVQAPRAGEEADWPFVSDFNTDMAAILAERQSAEASAD